MTALLAFTPLQTYETMNRTYDEEPPPGRAARSPVASPSSSSSTFGATQSPAPSHLSSRTLPSPSPAPYGAYPSSASNLQGSYGDGSLTAAQASQMQDMQHQISTKTLALQILQREHDQLLAAFSRSQIRCATFEKKSQVSDYEISTLLEEKGRFQRQIEAFESQVEELSHARDEAQRQISTDGAQWQQIMAMSAQLQARNVEETRQFRCDREAWERDRDGMQRRIRDLEAAQSTAGPTNDGTPISNDIYTASESLGTLREEIVRLQRRCSELEGLLQDIQGETEHMGPVLATLTNLSVRISALSSQTRPDLEMGPTAEQEVEPERE